MASFVFSPKSPTEVADYRFDFTNLLRKGETIISANFTAAPAGLTLGSPETTGTVVAVVVSGGVLGTTYEIDCTIVTSLGLVWNRGADLGIENL